MYLFKENKYLSLFLATGLSIGVGVGGFFIYKNVLKNKLETEKTISEELIILILKDIKREYFTVLSEMEKSFKILKEKNVPLSQIKDPQFKEYFFFQSIYFFHIILDPKFLSRIHKFEKDIYEKYGVTEEQFLSSMQNLKEENQ